MQKVSELKYERLSMEEFAQEIKEVIHQVKTADSAERFWLPVTAAIS